MKIKILAALLSITFLTQCTYTKDKVAKRTWQSKMDQFSAILTDLFPLLVSDDKFRDPVNKDRIQSHVKTLNTLAHSLNDKDDAASVLIATSNDPSMRYLSQLLKHELDSALDGLELGKSDYSRVVLKNITGICIECHTRGKWGKSFQKDLANSWQFKGLDTFDKAQLYTATRQYENALTIYEGIFNNFSKNKGFHFRWEKAAKMVLNLSVRIKQDPDLGLKTVNKILKHPNAALFLKNNARQWKRDLLSWKREKPLTSESAKFKFAKKLIKRAQLNQNYWADSTTYVLYLRASGILHDLLNSSTVKKAKKAESLYLLGQAYEALSAHSYSKLNEYYYKSCITYQPHSAQAVKCYQRYEVSVFLGYSGSGGFAAPPSSMQHLRYLKDLAMPKM